MLNRNKHSILTFIIATVWFANGLVCKVQNLAPRHEQIVARILGDAYSRPLTLFIGISEIIMAIWVLTKIKTKLNCITQMAIVLSMNVLEFIFVPDLLLWGRFNLVYALLFIGLIYYNEFVLNRKLHLLPT